MFNLNDTKHESGIVLYGGRAVGVFNWSQFANGFTPMGDPFGLVVCWQPDISEDAEITHIGHVEDVRYYLPGTVWMGEDGLDTDLNIVFDKNNDIPALFGFGPAADTYTDTDSPYSGDIWDIPGGLRVITIDMWI